MMDRRSFLELMGAAFPAAMYVPTPAAGPQLPVKLEGLTVECWHWRQKLTANAGPVIAPHDFAVARMAAEFVFQLDTIAVQLVIGGYPVFAGPVLYWLDGQFVIEPPRFASLILIPAGQSVELQSTGGPCDIWLEGLVAARPAEG